MVHLFGNSLGQVGSYLYFGGPSAHAEGTSAAPAIPSARADAATPMPIPVICFTRISVSPVFPPLMNLGDGGNYHEERQISSARSTRHRGSSARVFKMTPRLWAR